MRDYAAAARTLGITRAGMTQLMKLLSLALAVQERVLKGEFPGSERALPGSSAIDGMESLGTCNPTCRVAL